MTRILFKPLVYIKYLDEVITSIAIFFENSSSLLHEFSDLSRGNFSITISDESKLIVTSQKSSLVVWTLNKIEKSPVTMQSSNFTPIDDIEGLKSKLGMQTMIATLYGHLAIMTN